MSKGKDFKPHIGIFGRRNNGKSSLINALTGQDTAIVSSEPGTTTDPVKKSVEIFGVGPVILIDTAGIDDEGELGNMRVKRTMKIMDQIDMAVVLIAENNFGFPEVNIINELEERDVPYVIVHNKSDIEQLGYTVFEKIREVSEASVVNFSCLQPGSLDKLVEAIKSAIPETSYNSNSLFEGILEKGSIVLLITPIDNEAPEGRMILPQMMALRHALDEHCICVVLRETELEHFINNSNMKPALVVTDSQAFGFVSKIIPEDIPLTGFSILFARLRGDFEKFIQGIEALKNLQDRDKVLIMESCTHHVKCDDIGRFKIPQWIADYTEKNLIFEVISGNDKPALPEKEYAFVVQCGGCMFTKKQLSMRLKPFVEAGVPVTNYGMAIAELKGILKRALQPFENCSVNER